MQIIKMCLSVLILWWSFFIFENDSDTKWVEHHDSPARTVWQGMELLYNNKLLFFVLTYFVLLYTGYFTNKTDQRVSKIFYFLSNSHIQKRKILCLLTENESTSFQTWEGIVPYLHLDWSSPNRVSLHKTQLPTSQFHSSRHHWQR